MDSPPDGGSSDANAINVESGNQEGLIPGSFSDQLHITDNFTLVDGEHVEAGESFQQLPRGTARQRRIHFVEQVLGDGRRVEVSDARHCRKC